MVKTREQEGGVFKRMLMVLSGDMSWVHEPQNLEDWGDWAVEWVAVKAAVSLQPRLLFVVILVIMWV